MTIPRVVKTPSWLANTPTHKIWAGMIARCYTATQTSYPRYGGRGISVCERWLKFENFLEDMGERPSGMTLEREDNDGDYSPENCRWATVTEQNRHKRSNLKITFRGATMTAAEWERELGYPYGLIWRRIKRLNWEVERALSTPSRGSSCSRA